MRPPTCIYRPRGELGLAAPPLHLGVQLGLLFQVMETLVGVLLLVGQGGNFGQQPWLARQPMAPHIVAHVAGTSPPGTFRNVLQHSRSFQNLPENS